MLTLDESNLADYLRTVALIDAAEAVRVTWLSGGVSNEVFFVERSPAARASGQRDFVLKQARGQLRVAQPWFCSVERIWREIDVLRVAERVLRRGAGQAGCLPYVLYEDRQNFLFTMTAAPRASQTWKSQLLAGNFDESIAAACGSLLSALHAGTWNDTTLRQSLGDRTFFCDLRVDPYYRRAAEVRADLQPAIDELIASLAENCCCLVHGDFSPKNLLVWHEGLMLIDCEVGHYGDPAFDLGFFLTHLVAKGVRLAGLGAANSTPAFPTLGLCRSFLQAYAHGLEPAISHDQFAALQRRAVLNLAGCLLARVDGKSPLEYLSHDAERDALRQMARRLFEARPATIEAGLKTAVETVEAER